MSNMYVTEPATEGKVLLHTSFGDLDVELWPQQAPKACRNFVQLCLEGYYDNTIFHRIIKDFMVQGGDPTGTGSGGESVYGEPFIDEFHSRLKFNHRGIVAMANENKPNSNHSQFFFTLDTCEFLNRKHTIFGKITGNTIFNLLSVGEIDTDESDRPLSPPKLLSAEVLWNPFDDIVVRETKARGVEESASTKKKRERRGTKDRNLLSFGDDEDAFEDDEAAQAKTKKKKKLMSSHDLLEDKKLKAQVDEEIAQKIAETTKDVDGSNGSQGSKDKTPKLDARARLKAAVAAASSGQTKVEDDLEPVESAPIVIQPDQPDEKKKLKAAVKEEQDEYTRLREELKREKKAAAVLLGQKAREQELAKAKNEVLTPLQQQRAKFLERKKAMNRSGRQQDTLKKLEQFKATLLGVNKDTSTKVQTDETREAYQGQVLEDDDDSEELSGDNSWMTAKLKFKKHIDDQFRNNSGPGIDDYTTIDTRNERDKGKLNSNHNGERERGGGDSHRRNRSPGRTRDRSRERRRERSRSKERRR